ncbi:uncharacterized protein LOC134934633 [Pseudophryne corroboree]|uniref:uncharacterized protein LOC134934633 n=1 Tax=Pseudophryne corroboree TaxID=495146 RepID=UPI003081A34F
MDEYQLKILYCQAVAVNGLDRERRMRERRERRPTRSCWTKQWLLERDAMSHTPLLRELRDNNPEDYRNYLRMNDDMFQELLQLVTHLIVKQDTVMRRAISAEERLVATLRYLATGRPLQDLKFSTLISPQALGVIIPETCKALYSVLRKDYLKFPTKAEEWKDIARDFEDCWNFPNCGGAIDGKHVRISPPTKSGSLYYNYKGYFSIVLMAIVNANYEFIFVDVGKNGRASDGGSIKDTVFYVRLLCNQLDLPKAEDCMHGLNYVFVADEAFALHEHIMKPYPQRNLSKEKRIFNYRLSRARRIVENTFGILSSTVGSEFSTLLLA